MCIRYIKLKRMCISTMLISLSLYLSLLFFFISFASSSSFNATHKCSAKQALDLLLFKENMSSINRPYNKGNYVDTMCQDWLGSDNHPNMLNWNKKTDCCKWDGVTCSHTTGDVIGIDLSCGMLQGTIHPNTTLFHLPYLQTLNLAYNDFTDSQLPREIGRLSNSLTHLNLSHCSLTSVEIFFLSKLVFLDLSGNYVLQIQPSVLKNLLRTSTHLRELSIANVDISWVLPTYLDISSSLQSIDLSSTGLQGMLPDNIFSLQYLEKLDLSGNSGITGPFPKVSTSINIPLKWLDLSFTNLSGEIPESVGNLKSLNYLDLSYCAFVGSLPKSLVNLKHLTTLDLSHNVLNGTLPSFLFTFPFIEKLVLAWNKDLSGPWPEVNTSNMIPLKWLDLSFTNLSGEIPKSVGNLKYLNYLDLSYCAFVGSLPKSLVNLRHLTTLDLSHNVLNGTLPSFLFTLPFIEKLGLAWNNDLSGPWPEVNTSNMIPLKWLDLSFTNLSGEIPESVGNLKSLNYLDLSYCAFMGSLPKSLVNLRHLTTLDVSHNLLNGTLPSFLFTLPFIEKLGLAWNNELAGPWPEVNTSNTIPLNWLDLSFTNLSGRIPDSVGHLKSLKYLDLSYCGLVGSLPESLVNLRNLTSLILSSNKLNGTLPSFLFMLPLIENIILYGNMFSGGLPSEFFNCRSLKMLSLRKNQFEGAINGGSTPTSFSQLVNLTRLELRYNNFTGLWNLNALLSSLPNLRILGLSYSGLGLIVVNNDGANYVNNELWTLRLASCKLTVFPESLRAMKKLTILDLSDNDIHGAMPDWFGEIGWEIGGIKSLYVRSNQIQGRFPPSVCNMRNLEMLDISNNSFSGVIPQCLRNITSTLWYLNVKSNQIQGSFPSSLCNMSLLYLDMSNNSFIGTIPQCFGNLSSSLVMVDMGNNDFHGIIPNVYEDCGGLEGLVLNGNRLQGEVPSSFSKCQYLKVLDLGNNQLNGTFPHWLGDLPNLQVLVLKSNKLHGPIETSSAIKSAFPSMRVLVLSHNKFVGLLPQMYLQKFIAMKNVVKNNTTPAYLDMGQKYYTITASVKGADLQFPKIAVDYIIVDLSSNRFEGGIPGIIGGLTSLIVLDLSHNNLTGQIPSVLGNLSNIESLDLSWNQLTGEIPRRLAGLTFLGFLNLSQNHLKGRIPSGTQFSTFGNSFGGNPELCGLPLPKKCERPHETQPEVDGDEDGESGFTWRVVMLGYGCGTLPGLVIGYFMLSTKKPKRLNAFLVEVEHMIQKRKTKRRRRYIFIGN